MESQVVNFCNSLLSATGIFLGFSIASYIAVFLEYLKDLVKRYYGKEKTDGEFNKEGNKKHFINTCILMAFLFLLTLILMISIIMIQEVLAEDMRGLQVVEESLDKMQCASRLYVVAVIVTAVGMFLLPLISFLVVKFSSTQKKKPDEAQIGQE